MPIFGNMSGPENERFVCFFLAVVLLFLWMHYSDVLASALAPQEGSKVSVHFHHCHRVSDRFRAPHSSKGTCDAFL